MKYDICLIAGDIFCIEIDDSFKSYFQYMGNDKTKFELPVIRVFKTRYSLNYIPDLDDIVKDEILFYTHTVIYENYYIKPWFYVGNVLISEQETYQFRFIDYIKPINKNDNCASIQEESESATWWIWEKDNKPEILFPVPYKYIENLEDGGLKKPEEIIERIKSGFYRNSSPVYNVIRRKPISGVQSYIKIQWFTSIIYYHFDGENLIRQISISKIDGSNVISEYENEKGMKFWETNWRKYEFITPKQFESAWKKYTKTTTNPFAKVSEIITRLFK